MFSMTGIQILLHLSCCHCLMTYLRQLYSVVFPMASWIRASESQHAVELCLYWISNTMNLDILPIRKLFITYYCNKFSWLTGQRDNRRNLNNFRNENEQNKWVATTAKLKANIKCPGLDLSHLLLLSLLFLSFQSSSVRIETGGAHRRQTNTTGLVSLSRLSASTHSLLYSWELYSMLFQTHRM